MLFSSYRIHLRSSRNRCYLQISTIAKTLLTRTSTVLHAHPSDSIDDRLRTHQLQNLVSPHPQPPHTQRAKRTGSSNSTSRQ